MKKAILILIAFTSLMVSCNTRSTTGHDTSENMEGRADGQSEGIPQETDMPNLPENMNTDSEIMNKMIYELNDFSLGFYKKLSAEQQNENISYSPASLNMAMAIVYSGAREQTRQQMSKVFGFSYEPDVFHPHYHTYFSQVSKLSQDTLLDFNLANRVFLEQTYQVRDSYLNDVIQWHAGAFEKVDFRNNPGQTEEIINEWVENITRNRIQDIIPRGLLTDLTRLVLVNALYIKSDWRYPFEKEQTVKKMFTNSRGTETEKDFMTQRLERIKWYEQDDFIAMELPYKSPDLSLLLIRPNEEVVSDISQYIPDAELYRKIIDELSAETVIMEIPPFKIESRFALVDKLKEAGLVVAFDERADFSGISGQKDLLISDVIQKVFFEIDEKGSEAAAATAVVVVTTSMPVEPPGYEPKKFIADRPFIFILKENKFNTPLFVGQFVQ